MNISPCYLVTFGIGDFFFAREQPLTNFVLVFIQASFNRALSKPATILETFYNLFS